MKALEKSMPVTLGINLASSKDDAPTAQPMSKALSAAPEVSRSSVTTRVGNAHASCGTGSVPAASATLA